MPQEYGRSPSIHAWAENSNTTQYKPITLTKGLRDPTGMSVLVFLMIYADCRLFTMAPPGIHGFMHRQFCKNCANGFSCPPADTKVGSMAWANA